MHEMGIANSILSGVAKELQRRPGTRAAKVGVRIGELSGVDPDALSFAFEALTLDTEFAGLVLDVEYVASRSRCRECCREFEVRNYELICPACGSGMGSIAGMLVKPRVPSVRLSQCCITTVIVRQTHSVKMTK